MEKVGKEAQDQFTGAARGDSSGPVQLSAAGEAKVSQEAAETDSNASAKGPEEADDHHRWI